ncbi:ribonuclease R [Solitalea koreensis]|uniref:Ribonuclease R n=1 Tax=Solitalea koreensis TaxID=543615 RepID=A0A521BR18_9SPHI|nr:ribonuclease R [Solitalea koreensis]SMO49596.1 ribonuclease R [Solitalea koreensis]
MSKKKNSLKGLRQVFTQLVMNVLSQHSNQALNYKQISGKLNIADDESRQIILQVLKDEVRNGTVKEVSPGKFIAKDLKTYIIGKVDMAASGSAYVISPESERDIYIAPRKLRNALHGDTVKIFVYARPNGKQKEGEVVEIIERAKSEFTGLVKITGKFGFLIPDDRKMLHDIFIPTEGLNNVQDGMKAIGRITNWPEGAKNPIGEITHVLGMPGENNTEMHAILADFGFPLSFPKKVEEESQAISDVITPAEISKRRDFRAITTFTIDPADAKDFDDAISFQFLENGNYEIGVHIADVSHYVVPGTALDTEAQERGTSVYLVDRVIPMLPEHLSNGLCSLRPNEDKLCFSAVFEMNKEGQVITEWFGRTIINSDRRFAYEEAQEILETKQGQFSKELETLNEIAYKLRDQRFKHGAINFESTEVKFRLDEEGRPIGVYVKERKDAHKLIEDFMLLANRKVAEFIAKKGPKRNAYTFVYRVHDAPDEELLGKFAVFASRFGYKINTKNHHEISKSLNFLMDDVVGKKEQNVLTSLAIRSMAKAVYTTKKTSHYGLAFDFYTHFTSPIRRYPDVMTHRLLAHYLANGKSVNADEYEKKCEHSSQMEKRAAEAERASIKYKQAEYLKDNIGEEFDGIVSGVTEWGMYVEIVENKCEGMIRLRDMNDDFYVLDEANYCIIGQRKKKKYQLGDPVRIRVKTVNLVKRQIDFTMA